MKLMTSSFIIKVHRGWDTECVRHLNFFKSGFVFGELPAIPKISLRLSLYLLHFLCTTSSSTLLLLSSVCHPFSTPCVNSSSSFIASCSRLLPSNPPWTCTADKCFKSVIKIKKSARHLAGLNPRWGLVCHPLQYLIYSVILNHHSFGSADLPEFGGSLSLRRSKKRARVLQSAAKGHLVDLAVCSIAAHLAFVVWQHFGHCGTKNNLSSATGVVRKISEQEDKLSSKSVFKCKVFFPVWVLVWGQV